MRRAGWAGALQRWRLPAGLGILALLSLLILEVDYRRGLVTFERSVVAVDNLTRARVAVAEAAAAWEGVLAGDPTYGPSDPAVRLDEATGALQDLLQGRSALTGFEAPGSILEPGLAAALQGYLTRVGEVRAEIVAGTGGRDPVAQRLRLRRLAEAARDLEDEVHDVIQQRIQEKRTRHRALLAAWAGFLVLSLGLVETVRAARRRAEHGGRRAEERRRAAEERYETLEALAAVGVLRTDGGGVVREATSWWRRTLGRVEECVGSAWWILVREEDRDRVAGSWRERASLGVAFSLDVAVTNAEGGVRWLAGRWEPRDDEVGSAWVGSFVDATEQRAIEAQLHQAQKLEAVGRLTGGLAHDFNNLLSVILTNTQLLLMDPRELSADQREMVEDMSRAAEGGRDLIKRLMGFSRRADLDPVPVDLSETVRKAETLARKLVPDSIALRVSLPDPGPKVVADPRAVEQILLNLVSNARDAMPRGGAVRITVDEVDADAGFRGERPWVEPGRYGRVTVSDEGTGMDEAVLEQIFEPFFTTKPEGKGTGLGLATAHGLMRQQGGHVRVYSALGKGTTFRLYFPRALEGGGRVGRPSDVVGWEGPAADARGLTVLLVEDDEALRRTSSRMLVRLGYRVVEAAGAREALALLESGVQPIDVIFSDLSMPGMDGHEMFEVLRARGDRRPFIFASGLTERDVAERGVLPPGVHFLCKPWTAGQFQELISGLDLRAG